MKVVVSKIVFVLVLSLTWFPGFSQELNCMVQVQAPGIQGTAQKKVISSMELAVREFMNSTKWTTDKFKVEERIDCNILITISEMSSMTQFDGDIQVQVSRPAFNSNYNATLVNILDDDFTVQYLENAAIEFTPDVHRSNLASILSYYAYVIIGYDYDSQSLEGGTPYFSKAQQIVNNAQNAPEKGWKAFENLKNRYWLVDNMLHRMFKPLRECIYKYHRHGLDKMYENERAGRQAITESVTMLQKVHQSKPGSYNMQLFFGAKSDELVNLYSQAQAQEKSQIIEVLEVLDAPNSSKYQRIITGK